MAKRKTSGRSREATAALDRMRESITELERAHVDIAETECTRERFDEVQCNNVDANEPECIRTDRSPSSLKRARVATMTVPNRIRVDFDMYDSASEDTKGLIKPVEEVFDAIALTGREKGEDNVEATSAVRIAEAEVESDSETESWEAKTAEMCAGLQREMIQAIAVPKRNPSNRTASSNAFLHSYSGARTTITTPSTSRSSAWLKTPKAAFVDKVYAKGNRVDTMLSKWFQGGNAPLLPILAYDLLLSALEIFSAKLDGRECGADSMERAVDVFTPEIWDTGPLPKKDPTNDKTHLWESSCFKSYYVVTNQEAPREKWVLGHVPKSWRNALYEFLPSQRHQFLASRKSALQFVFATIRRLLFLGIHLRSTKWGNHLLQQGIAGPSTVFAMNTVMNEEVFNRSKEAYVKEGRMQSQGVYTMLESIMRCTISRQAWILFCVPHGIVRNFPKKFFEGTGLAPDHFTDPTSEFFTELICTGLRLFAVVYTTIRSLVPLSDVGDQESLNAMSSMWTVGDLEYVFMSNDNVVRNFEQAIVSFISFTYSCGHGRSNPFCILRNAKASDSQNSRDTLALAEHYRALRSQAKMSAGSSGARTHGEKPKMFFDDYPGGVREFLKARLFHGGNRKIQSLASYIRERIPCRSMPSIWGLQYPYTGFLDNGARENQLFIASENLLTNQRAVLRNPDIMERVNANVEQVVTKFGDQDFAFVSNRAAGGDEDNTDRARELRFNLWRAVIEFAKYSSLPLLTPPHDYEFGPELSTEAPPPAQPADHGGLAHFL